MNRQGVFWLAAFLGGLLVFLQPWWLGLLLIGWAGLKAWRFANGALVVLAGLGLVLGAWQRQQTLAPPVPAGAVRVLPTGWTLQGGTARYVGTAQNGVPMSGLVTVTPVQAAALEALTTPALVTWTKAPVRLSGARNQYEFDYAQFAWRQSALAYQSETQPLVWRPLPVDTVVDWLAGLQAKFVQRLNRLPDRVAAYAKGLLLGQLDADFAAQRQTFSDLGIFHLFSVSGLHLFVLIGALYALSDRLRLPKEGVDWALIGLLPSLLILIPPGAGITRAVGLRVVALLNARLHWRLTQLDCFSLVLMLNLLWRPWVLHTFGGQLTYLLCGVLLLTAGGRLATAWHMALAATPVVIAQTFRLHLLTVGFNWLLMPVFELGLMPALVLVAIWPQPQLTALLERVIEAGEAALMQVGTLPGQVIFGAVPAGLTVLGVAAVLVGLGRRRWGPLVVWVVMAWLVANVHPAWRVTVFDVGQGDAILIEAPFKGGTVLIDTGGRGFGTSSNPPAQRAIVNYLHARGVARLDALILTHPDADHVGDAPLLASLIPVTTLYTTPAALADATIQAVAGEVSQTKQVLAGATLAVGAIHLRVVSPQTSSLTDKNADSLVIYGRIDNENWLLTGDADETVERTVLMPQKLAVDFLKAGHHGSKTSTSAEFLAQIQPQAALISAGVANRYGHPAPETLARLTAAHVPWLSTAESGMIWRENHRFYTFLEGPSHASR
ncbi:ComEC/Rec2 family competence protein [Lacticaseibacillus parakribbianus]|uniref:ComEC/Rec2 family competence protein n=1 Tax=Lacticaseibacillus parakribbianus TaxID=2970927 RepID=UPI0021CB8CF9|nr:ComEC/Rec2 family competence protein [Lacticaseibacillus parakribbianus]